DLADLLGMGLAQGAAEDGEILAEHIDQAAVDGTKAGHDPITGVDLVFHAEILAPVRNEGAGFLEGAFVEQQLQALARGKLALLMLSVNSGLSAAQVSGGCLLAERLDFVFHRAAKIVGALASGGD